VRCAGHVQDGVDAAEEQLAVTLFDDFFVIVRLRRRSGGGLEI
jgi:hypothetical protein